MSETQNRHGVLQSIQSYDHQNISNLAPVILIVSKLLHLPEEAALVLRAHELSLVEDWSVWMDSLAHNLMNQSRTRPGFVHTVQDYNAQACNFKTKGAQFNSLCSS